MGRIRTKYPGCYGDGGSGTPIIFCLISHWRKGKAMSENKLYSIGQVSKICDVSQRMLRYYEEIGLVTPDHVVEPSHYRYYTVQTMQHIQNIRYLIDQGFSLDEIKVVVSEDNLDRFQTLFLQKIDETKGEIEYYHQRLDCLRAWYALLVEGCEVYRHNNRAITVKYVPKNQFFRYERERSLDEKDPVAHLETESFTLTKHDGHSMVDMGGAFHVKYDSYHERMDDTYRHMTLLQAMFPNSKRVCNC